MKMKSNELKNKKNKSYFSAYNILLIIIGLLCFSAILAPILMALGLEGPAKYIYFIYSFFCHQIHYRSLHELGLPGIMREFFMRVQTLLGCSREVYWELE